ncbi:MAG: S49 family peptidase, partial [Candidatus Competibacteraceae bacterium]|nr:S49 family peptidase [Candidatus Competibacteraceae bacterium]
PDMPVYAVIGDIGASGGYYIAAAADEIYANRASIVGSIGVRADNFGFTEAMEKLGVERRLYTAGQNKGFLDPFLPEDPRDVAHLQQLLNDIHGQFIAAVRQGRGDRLQESPELYSGLVWTGEYGLELGLLDGLADVRYVAEELLEVEEVVDYSYRPPLFEQILGQVETALVGGLLRASEAKLELH